MAFDSVGEFAAKVDWEGGVLDSLDYGLTANDLPDGNDELAALWDAAAEKYAVLSGLIDRIEGILDDERSDG